MRKWSKKLGYVAGGLLGLGELIAPVHAQLPPGGMQSPYRPIFANDPQPPCPPDFPNPGSPGSGGAGDRATAFSIRDDGAPNAFTDLDSPVAPHPYTVLFRAEYLNWRIENSRLSSALVTTSTSDSPNLFVDNGSLGAASTQVLLGQGDYSFDQIGGGRGTFGIAPYYLPPIEFTVFSLKRDVSLFNEGTDGSPGTRLLTRPLQLADNVGQLNFPTEDVTFVAIPGVLAGSIDVSARVHFWGLETNFIVPLGASDVLQVYFIGGYRHADLTDEIDIRTSYSPLPGTFTNFLGDPNGFGVGTTTNIQDRFRARSEFDGGQFGLRSILSFSRMNLWLDTKLALGNTRQTLNVDGSSTLVAGNNSATVGSGVLAGPSNIGATSANDFSVIPEANLNLGIQLHPNIRLFGGYNVLYWNRIVRAGDQISTLVDTRQIPTDINFVNGFTGNVPTRSLTSSNLFVHGFTIGLEVGF